MNSLIERIVIDRKELIRKHNLKIKEMNKELEILIDKCPHKKKTLLKYDTNQKGGWYKCRSCESTLFIIDKENKVQKIIKDLIKKESDESVGEDLK